MRKENVRKIIIGITATAVVGTSSALVAFAGLQNKTDGAVKNDNIKVTAGAGEVVKKTLIVDGEVDVRVSAKDLTDEEKAAMKAEMITKMKIKLDALVADGKLTQEQADKILSGAEGFGTGDFGIKIGDDELKSSLKHFRFNFDGDEFEFSYGQDMTEEEKAEMKAKIKEKLDALVTGGKLTQEQADKILTGAENFKFDINSEFPVKKELTEEEKAEIQVRLKEKLDALVTEGKLTQEQADKILENGRYFSENSDEINSKIKEKVDGLKDSIKKSLPGTETQKASPKTEKDSATIKDTSI